MLRSARIILYKDIETLNIAHVPPMNSKRKVMAEKPVGVAQ